MEIKTDDYRICYDPETLTVSCQGSLRLSGMAEYAPIAELLDDIASQEQSPVVLDLQGLEFLNSSGISMLSKFVIKVRHKKNGDDDCSWLEGDSLARKVSEKFTTVDALPNPRMG